MDKQVTNFLKKGMNQQPVLLCIAEANMQTHSAREFRSH